MHAYAVYLRGKVPKGRQRAPAHEISYYSGQHRHYAHHVPAIVAEGGLYLRKLGGKLRAEALRLSIVHGLPAFRGKAQGVLPQLVHHGQPVAAKQRFHQYAANGDHAHGHKCDPPFKR